jgi:hypothetical protein
VTPAARWRNCRRGSFMMCPLTNRSAARSPRAPFKIDVQNACPPTASTLPLIGGTTARSAGSSRRSYSGSRFAGRGLTAPHPNVHLGIVGDEAADRQGHRAPAELLGKGEPQQGSACSLVDETKRSPSLRLWCWRRRRENNTGRNTSFAHLLTDERAHAGGSKVPSQQLYRMGTQVNCIRPTGPPIEYIAMNFH